MSVLADQFAAMSLEMAGEDGLPRTLDRVCSSALKAVDAQGAVIFLARGGTVEVAGASDAAAARVGRVPIESGEGPCREAVWASDNFQVHNTRGEARWPRWAPLMVELGWLSVISLYLGVPERPHLGLPARTLGSLNLMSREPYAFDTDDVDVGQIFARHATVAVLHAQQRDTLTEAVTARHRIGMAQGILMCKYGLDQETAFAVLRRYARDTNTKLHAVAAYVVRQRDLPSKGESGLG